MRKNQSKLHKFEFFFLHAIIQHCTSYVKYKQIRIAEEFSFLFFLLNNRCVLLLK